MVGVGKPRRTSAFILTLRRAQAPRMLATGGRWLWRWSGHQPYRICCTREACPAPTVLAAGERSMCPVYRRAPQHELLLEQLYYTSDRNARAHATARPPDHWGSSPEACGGLLRSSTSTCACAASVWSGSECCAIHSAARLWRSPGRRAKTSPTAQAASLASQVTANDTARTLTRQFPRCDGPERQGQRYIVGAAAPQCAGWPRETSCWQ